MAGFDTLALGSDGNRAMAALLFMQSSTNAMDVYSALNSSPWTAESFGGDEDKRASCLEYVHHSLAVTAGFSIGSALLAGSWWPVLGWAISSAYMYWLYTRALRRAVEAGSTGWGT